GLGWGLSVGQAEQLPLKSYRNADGLSSDNVSCIVQDSRGFLWFGATFGLSRFDGARFTNYGEREGITFPIVNGLTETRQGVYLVATNGGGVFRLDPHVGSSDGKELGNARFANYRIGDSPATNRVNALYEDRAGYIWVGTDAGLFRLS